MEGAGARGKAQDPVTPTQRMGQEDGETCVCQCLPDKPTYDQLLFDDSGTVRPNA